MSKSLMGTITVMVSLAQFKTLKLCYEPILAVLHKSVINMKWIFTACYFPRFSENENRDGIVSTPLSDIIHGI